MLRNRDTSRVQFKIETIVPIMLKALNFIPKGERRELLWLLVLGFATALFEVAGVASIFPLMAVLTNPDLINTNQAISFIYKLMPVGNKKEFLILLTFVFFVVTVIALILKSTYYYWQYKISLLTEYAIGVKLLTKYLNKPYSWHLNKHSGELTKNILSQTSLVIAEVMLPALTLISHMMIAILVLGLLLGLYPVITLIVAFVLGFAYALTVIGLKKLAVRTGKDRLAANEKRFKMVNEILGGVKEIKLFQAEEEFRKRFSVPAKEYAEKSTVGKALSILPKYILEGLAFGGFLLILGYLLIVDKDISTILPTMSIFAVASYKLMPSLQNIYSSAMSVRHSWEAFQNLALELNEYQPTADIVSKNRDLSFAKSIDLVNVSFAYPGHSNYAINDVSISLPANRSIGIVGPSGSGKSTLVDILSGLHSPTSGNIRCDGFDINESNLDLWKSHIGYVPQTIYLMDDTIVANIAFGISSTDIDMERLIYAAKKANIHSFIMEELPQEYLTIVGERGARLSGGQRQRIGLARALYKRSTILILDEATSALDNLTEQVFLSNARQLSVDHTVIIIAHRLSTIQDCDLIFYVQAGAVIASGSYNNLLQNSKEFSNLVNAESNT
jgi:ABC-type multidrug transport system fused ATPase/permease subunit